MYIFKYTRYLVGASSLNKASHSGAKRTKNGKKIRIFKIHSIVETELVLFDSG